MNPLTHHRTAAGLTVAQLAKRIHKPQSQIRKWEAGAYFSTEDRIAVAAALGLQPLDLFPGHAAVRPLKAVSDTIAHLSGDPVAGLRLAVYRAENELLMAENADTFTAESNRAVREATARLKAARDALYAATRRPLVEALPEHEECA